MTEATDKNVTDPQGSATYTFRSMSGEYAAAFWGKPDMAKSPVWWAVYVDGRLISSEWRIEGETVALPLGGINEKCAKGSLRRWLERGGWDTREAEQAACEAWDARMFGPIIPRVEAVVTGYTAADVLAMDRALTRAHGWICGHPLSRLRDRDVEGLEAAHDLIVAVLEQLKASEA